MSPSESNPDQLTRRLQGDTAIAQAAESARAFGEMQWLGEDELSRLCIVIEELVANLYDHGGLSAKDVVELSLAVDPEGIRVCIRDPGKPFDPWSAPMKAVRTERGGGAGIDIVRAWAHFISYDVLPGGNRLEFVLPFNWEG